MKVNIRSRRGISIVEVVIALVIITIISASALSMIMMSVEVERKSVMAVEVENCAENAIECFRYADDEGEFLTCLQKTGSFTKEEDGSFVLRASGYTVTITPENDEFAFTAVSTGGVEICAFTFTKGGGAG